MLLLLMGTWVIVGAIGQDASLLRDARVHAEAGRYESAEAAVRAVLEAEPASPQGLGLGLQIAWAAGDYATAHARLETLCRLAESGGAEAPFLLDAWLEASSWAYWMGDAEEALALGEQVIAEAERRGQAWAVVEALKTISVVHEELGDLDAAVASSERALEVPLDPPLDWRHADVLVNLGRVRRIQGKYDEALSCFDAVEPLVLGTDHEARSTFAEHGRLEVELACGVEPDELLPRVEAIVAHYRKSGYTLSGLDLLGRVRLAAGDLSGAAAALSEAEALLDQPRALGLGAVAAAGFRSRYAQFAELSQDLHAAQGEEAVLAGWDASCRWKGRAILEGLASRHGELAHTRADTEAIRAVVGPRAAVVEYAPGAEQMFAYVLEPEQAARRIDLGDRGEIEALAARHLEHISELAPSSTASEIASTGGELHARLIAPLNLRHDEKPRPLVLVPSAALAQLPFCALVSQVEPGPASFGRMRFLIDDFVLSYAPSLPVLCWTSIRARREPGRALFLADARFESDELRYSKREALTALEVLLDRDELDQRATELFDLLLAEGRDHRLTTRRAELRLGSHVCPEVFTEDLSGYSLIHIGSHATADPVNPRRSRLELSGGAQLGLEELRALKLDAELFVLSACSTARGPIVKGEGVQSLATAALQAGSRGVVATLWRVYDLETMAVMGSVYRDALEPNREGISLSGVPAALRAAQVELAGRGGRSGVPVVPKAAGGQREEHPNAWAAYLYVGPPGG